MRKLLFTALTLALLSSCNNQSQNSDSQDSLAVENSGSQAEKGKIVFEQDMYDFGTVKEGTVVDHIFKFKNEGQAPVILAQVSASCGCTTPDYTKEPILPGKEGEIKVSFNSAGHPGVQQKIVTISSNAQDSVMTVQIKGTVEQ